MDDSSDSIPLSQSPVALWKERFTRRRGVRLFAVLEDLLPRFSTSERFALYILTGTLFLSVFAMLASLNNKISVVLPAHGGSLVEGEIGPVRFINPILTVSQPDQDIAALVYSGLTRALPDGSIIPDLAESYTISPDGTVYTFILKPDVVFTDGTPVTSADVTFTIQKAEDPALESPERADWAGVTVTTPDSRTVVFTLAHAYAPFIENTTLGILPKHLWQNVSDDEFRFDTLNTHPIGSGPFYVQSMQTDSTGAATRYSLAAFKRFALGAPYLDSITFVFYPDTASMQKAFNSRRIDAMAGVDPSSLATTRSYGAQIVTPILPRDYGVFFNTAHNQALSDLSARQALDAAIDKQAIVDGVLRGYGAVLDGPIPADLLNTTDSSLPGPLVAPQAAASSTASVSFAGNARTILENGGWKFDTASGVWIKGKTALTLTIATADTPQLVATAQAIAADWGAAGIPAAVHIYPLSELNTNVIEPRQYDAILFGEVVGPQLDLYAFWNSTQRTDPGLNLAMYANTKTDALLSEARSTSDASERIALYTEFANDLKKDSPAVFLYSPEFLYIVPVSLQGIELGALTTPADRFANAYDWYTQTQHVWAVFQSVAR